ncbi:flagellar protein FlgN [Anaerosalibacter bizertensis]|uniref:flagellar export chaperone FlgN n=1 Tax=Anaerosalibacter bizertensis TaxID=932217 RepID=UPI001C0F2D28|nr:flagellar export chaperone FlgN [Anaerosalibacter bizertensis]MBU5293016.1 flagellar protein FlgN [Anaerosalibacter bizertensis]
MAKELIDSMIYISKEKLGHLNSILKLTKVQKKYIGKEDMLSNDEILDKKDEIIKKIDVLDREFLIKFSELKNKCNIDDINELNVEEYPNLRELKETIREISSTLMAISILDEENNKVLKKSLEKIKLDLKKLKKGKKAYKGYNKTLDSNIFIDEKK